MTAGSAGETEARQNLTLVTGLLTTTYGACPLKWSREVLDSELKTMPETRVKTTLTEPTALRTALFRLTLSAPKWVGSGMADLTALDTTKMT